MNDLVKPGAERSEVGAESDQRAVSVPLEWLTGESDRLPYSRFSGGRSGPSRNRSS